MVMARKKRSILLVSDLVRYTRYHRTYILRAMMRSMTMVSQRASVSSSLNSSDTPGICFICAALLACQYGFLESSLYFLLRHCI